MRHVYLAATGQNRGKTTVSLGVLDGFLRRGLSASFLKPVGQRTVIEDGVPADEDAVLMKQVFHLREPLGQMSPVHIPRGFTQAYIEGDVVEDLPARIRAAHAAFADRDTLLIEGTGHAGVGAVIGLSNATVASLLAAPAVIVSEGGVGRPIDEIVLNAALFERHGVKVAGAIVNKVDLDAKPGLARTLERGLARHGIPLLGVLPYRPILSNPTLAMVLEGVHGETIHPGPTSIR
jgi:dethiobiotin synthetase